MELMKLPRARSQQDLVDEARKTVLASSPPHPSDKEKATMTARFRKLVGELREIDEDAVRHARAIACEHNVAVFLDDPVAVLKHLRNEGGRSLTLGEMLSCYGIGSVKSKRHGKGVFLHRGTLAAGTVSQFTVTVTIGHKTKTKESGSRNDPRSREDMEMLELGAFAMELAGITYGDLI